MLRIKHVFYVFLVIFVLYNKKLLLKIINKQTLSFCSHKAMCMPLPLNMSDFLLTSIAL